MFFLFVAVIGRAKDEITVLQWNVWQEGTMVPGGYDAIKMFIEQAAKDQAEGYSVIIGGDFNEPSHKDWIEAKR